MEVMVNRANYHPWAKKLNFDILASVAHVERDNGQQMQVAF